MKTTQLNLLDAAFLNIERAEDPWSIHLELQLEGRLNEERLRSAVAHALCQHPMARAHLKPYGMGSTRYLWELGNSLHALPLSVVEAPGADALEDERSRLLSKVVPVSESPAFRLVLVRQDEGDTLLMNLNHVLADGLSAMRIINSIIRYYADEPDPLPDVDPLAVRDLSVLAGTANVRERIARIKLFGEYLLDSTTPPIRVAPRHNDPDLSHAGYGTHTLCLNPEDSALVASRRKKPATVNDLLIAALILSIRRWNEESGGKTGKVSVMMPVNLRPQEWWYEVVGNYSSYVNVILRDGEQTDVDAACRAVCEQTVRFKEAGAAGTLIDVLAVPRFLPAILKARLKDIAPGIGRSHVQTSWLSNLGRLPQAPVVGDAGRVRAIYFSPPAPMPMGVSVGAASLEDQLMLTLRYRRSMFDAAAARDFAGLFRSVLLD